MLFRSGPWKAIQSWQHDNVTVYGESEFIVAVTFPETYTALNPEPPFPVKWHVNNARFIAACNPKVIVELLENFDSVLLSESRSTDLLREMLIDKVGINSYWTERVKTVLAEKK